MKHIKMHERESCCECGKKITALYRYTNPDLCGMCDLEERGCL